MLAIPKPNRVQKLNIYIFELNNPPRSNKSYLAMYSLLLNHNSYLVMEWGEGGRLPWGTWAWFDGASEVEVDVDAVLALFDPLVDDGPVVVVSLPMLDHQKCPKLEYAKPLAKPKNPINKCWKEGYSLARTTPMWRWWPTSNKLAQALKFQWRWNCRERTWWGMVANGGARWSLSCGELEFDDRMAEKHLKVAEVLEREK